MKRRTVVPLIGTALIPFLLGLSPVVFDPDMEKSAVNITVVNSRGEADAAIIQKVRNTVGRAIASETVDIFDIYYPKAGRPALPRLGLSACAQASIYSTSQEFNNFVEQLRSIHPQADTFLTVELTDACKEMEPAEPMECGGILDTQCPAGQYCQTRIGHCRADDADGKDVGLCRPVPEVCAENLRPVCGCDGKTYDNACEAARAGVSLDHRERCEMPEELAF